MRDRLELIRDRDAHLRAAFEAQKNVDTVLDEAVLYDRYLEEGASNKKELAHWKRMRAQKLKQAIAWRRSQQGHRELARQLLGDIELAGGFGHD